MSCDRTEVPRLWDLIEQGLEIDGARTIHLTVGRPPMVRILDEGIRPFPGAYPTLNHETIMLMLATTVDPEQWDRLERTGEGDVRLTPLSGGRPITATLFKSAEAWSCVIHL